VSRSGPVFYEHVTRAALWSARVVLPMVRHLLPVRSVVDFGCGEGAWLAVWRELGVEQTTGVDGSFVDLDRLLSSREEFVLGDLSAPFDLSRRFDLVQSLEVAEHLPPESAETHVETLVRHGPLILFSAAVCGQGGHGHLNERPYEYWRSLFAARGYSALDPFRGALARDRRVSPWYRYNLLLYANEEGLNAHRALAAHRIPEDRAVPDLAPALYQLRRFALRRLPGALVTRLAQVKEVKSVISARMTGR
jgi:SAM-dependent methyltransferase